MTMSKTRNRERMARNFIKTYGRVKFNQLLSDIAAQKSGQSIANELNVSRQRVQQWKTAFGSQLTCYQLFPEIEQICNELRGPRNPQEASRQRALRNDRSYRATPRR